VREKRVTIHSARASATGSAQGSVASATSAQRRQKSDRPSTPRLPANETAAPADTAEQGDSPGEALRPQPEWLQGMHVKFPSLAAGAAPRRPQGWLSGEKPWKGNIVEHQGQGAEALVWKSVYQDSHEEAPVVRATVRLARSANKRFPRRKPLPEDELEALRQRKDMQEEAWKEMFRQQRRAVGGSAASVSEATITASCVTAGLRSKEVEEMAERNQSSLSASAALPMRGTEDTDFIVPFPWRI